MSASEIIQYTQPFITPLGPLFSVLIGISVAFKIADGVRKLFSFKGL